MVRCDGCERPTGKRLRAPYELGFVSGRRNLGHGRDIPPTRRGWSVDLVLHRASGYVAGMQPGRSTVLLLGCAMWIASCGARTSLQTGSGSGPAGDDSGTDAGPDTTPPIDAPNDADGPPRILLPPPIGVPQAVAVDSRGDIVVGGYREVGYPWELQLTKLTPAGDMVWMRTRGGLHRNNAVYAIALDAADRIYATGQIKTDDGREGLWLARYSPDGELDVERVLPTTELSNDRQPGPLIGYSIARYENNLYVAGAAYFDDSYHRFVGGFDMALDQRWLDWSPGPGFSHAVATDVEGSLLIAGSQSGVTDRQGIVDKWTADPVPVWTASFADDPSTDGSQLLSAAFDASNRPVVGGSLYKKKRLTDSTVTYNEPFVEGLSVDGKSRWRWVHPAAAVVKGRVNALVPLPNGETVTAGENPDRNSGAGSHRMTVRRFSGDGAMTPLYAAAEPSTGLALTREGSDGLVVVGLTGTVEKRGLLLRLRL